MLKKNLLISIFSIFVLAYSSLGWTSSAVEGTYLIDGKLKATVKVPGLFSLSASLSELELFGEAFYFNPDGSFSEELLAIQGTWEESGSNFTVNIDLDALLAELEERYKILGEVTKYSFTGKLLSNGNITGKAALNLNVSMPLGSATLTGTVSISGTFTGTEVVPAPSSPQKSGSSRSLAGFIAEKLLAPIPRNR
jgi:hypothetical protein